MIQKIIDNLIDVNMRVIVITGIVLVLRMMFAKMNISKKYANLLWILPYLCLVLPWRAESDISLWNVFPQYESKCEVQSEYNAEAWDNHESQNMPTSDNAANRNNAQLVGDIAIADTLNSEATTEPAGTAAIIILAVWLTGMAVIAAYSIISYMKLRKKVICSYCVKDNIYCTDDIETPFVFGIIRPRIYISSLIKQEDLRYVLEHEQTHILRNDHLKKMATYVISMIHWFNPMVWVAFYCFGKDMEMSCDEETVWRIGMENKQDYAHVLLNTAAGKNIFNGAGVPLAFCEGNTEGRIKNILKYRKTTGFVAILAVVGVAVLCAVLLTNPKTDASSPDNTSETVSQNYSEPDDKQALSTDENEILKYVQINLPQEMKLGAYEKCINDIWDGCFFEGDFAVIPHGESSPKAWYGVGGIGMVEKAVYDVAAFEDGKFKSVTTLGNNLGRSSDFEPVEGCDMQAIMCEYVFDLFVGPEKEEYIKKNGLTQEKFDEIAMSKYWYIYFAEPESEHVFTLYLNQQYFTKDEAISLAKTMKF